MGMSTIPRQGLSSELVDQHKINPTVVLFAFIWVQYGIIWWG